jgi:hypothetical protein
MKGELAGPALACVQRALGLEDRDAASPTYGCFDRPFWHYKLSDFPSAWFAAGAYFLAQVATYDLPGNGWTKHTDRLREWSRAAVAFAAAQAHGDGSLAEVYPFERSYCATAFAGLHLGLAVARLGIEPPPELRRIGAWLAKARPTEAANQVAAAAAALAALGRAEAAAPLLDRLLVMQQPSGAFPEYGGLDVGYQTVTLSCLAHLAALAPALAARIEPAAAKGVAAIAPLVRDDGTYEWRGTSRRTQFLYPHALVRFAPELAKRFTVGLERERVITPLWLDDRYFLHAAVDFLDAARFVKERATA